MDRKKQLKQAYKRKEPEKIVEQLVRANETTEKIDFDERKPACKKLEFIKSNTKKFGVK